MGKPSTYLKNSTIALTTALFGLVASTVCLSKHDTHIDAVYAPGITEWYGAYTESLRRKAPVCGIGGEVGVAATAPGRKRVRQNGDVETYHSYISFDRYKGGLYGMGQGFIIQDKDGKITDDLGSHGDPYDSLARLPEVVSETDILIAMCERLAWQNLPSPPLK
jgi:hypothetical protein